MAVNMLGHNVSHFVWV